MFRIPVLIAVLAGAEAGQAQPAFRSSVDLVTVPVTVTAREQAWRVGELGPADFRIFEDGVPQELSLVTHEPRALSICILLDSSPSMASTRQRFAIRTVDTLLGSLAPGDEATMVFFASKPQIAFPWTRGADVRPVSWIEWRLSLGTALIDAMKEGLRLIEQASNPLPVIVVVSDGGENASGTSLASLAATRRQSETMIYGIHTDLPPSKFAPPVNRAFTDFLPELVSNSGGTVYEVKSAEAGEAAARAFLEELRSQYTLGYVPKRAADGKYRTVKVESTNRNLVLRHRAGYLAAVRR
ncbi:MAG: VWA domain-containing protein [Vicinamibacterales bacterium]